MRLSGYISWPFVLLLVVLLGGCGIFDGSARQKKLIQIAIWEDQATLHGGDLLAYLSDRDVEVRRRAVIAIGRVGDTMAVEALAGALADPDTIVRARVALSLGFLKHRAARPLVYQRIKDENHGFVLEYLLWAMGRLYAQEYGDSLLRFLEHPDPRVRGQAALMMNQFVYRPAGAAMIRLIDDPDVTVRRRALRALALLALPEHADLIYPKLEDPDIIIRGRAAVALGATRDTAYGRQLLALLDDPDRQVRLDAAHALYSLRDTVFIEAVYPYLLTEKDPLVLGQFVEAIGRHWQSEAAPYLLKLKDHPDIGVRVKLVGALLRSLRQDAFDALLPFADDPAWPVRAVLPAQLEYFAKSAWGHATEVVEMMVKLANDSVPGVRASVVKSAMSFGSAMRGPATDALHDPDDFVKYYALNILPFAGGKTSFDTLRQWYEDCKDDPRPDIRMAILALTANLSPSVQIGETQRKIFEMGITDADRLVRQYAAAVWEKFREDHWAEVGVFDSPINERTYDEYYREYPTPPRVRFITQKGDFTVQLYADETPRSVHHFLSLVRSGFYDQTPVGLNDNARRMNLGDRRADGWGLSRETVRDEITLRRTERGSLVWSVIHRHDARSVFGICLRPQPLYDFVSTVFGKVVEGMDTVDRLRPLDMIEKVEIVSAEIAVH